MCCNVSGQSWINSIKLEFDQNEDTFLIYFDKMEHPLIENGQKQHAWAISNAREKSRLCFKIWNSFLKFVRFVAAEQNNNDNENSDSSHFLPINPNCKTWKFEVWS